MIQNLKRNWIAVSKYVEFDKFWPEHSRVSKRFTLMGSFWAKYTIFELKRYRGVIFDDTEESCKIWRGIDLSCQNWHEEFNKFWPQHLKVSKICTFSLSNSSQSHRFSFFWCNLCTATPDVSSLNINNAARVCRLSSHFLRLFTTTLLFLVYFSISRPRSIYVVSMWSV